MAKRGPKPKSYGPTTGTKKKSITDPRSLQVLPMDNYTVQDLAKIFEVAVGTARGWCKRGEIACIMRSNKYEISKQSMIDFAVKRYQ